MWQEILLCYLSIQNLLPKPFVRININKGGTGKTELFLILEGDQENSEMIRIIQDYSSIPFVNWKQKHCLVNVGSELNCIPGKRRNLL